VSTATEHPAHYLAGPFAPAASRAVITGAGSGIGRDIAVLLGRAGVEVHLVGRRREPLAETAAAIGGNAHVHPGDIRHADRMDEVFAEIEAAGDPAPMLVNAASGAFLAAAENISPRGFATVVDASLNGPFIVLRRWARPLLERQMRGVALLVSSALAAREVPGAAHSSAAKAGLEALVRSVAVEWGPRGLRVNALAPGAFATEGATEGMWSHPDVAAAARAAIPLGRFGRPDELRWAAAFLLSQAASYITGATLVVDGGWRLSPHPFGTVFPERRRA